MDLASAPESSVVGAKVKSAFVVQVGEQENATANEGKWKRVSQKNICFEGVIVSDHCFEGENGAKSEKMKLDQHFVYDVKKMCGNLCEKSERIKNGDGSSGLCKLFAL